MNKTELWTCPSCGCKIEWTYLYVVRYGNPVCPECDYDMEWEETIDD